MRFLTRFIIIFFIFLPSVLAQSNFIIKHIQIKGLQRITRATVLNYLPVHVGDRITPELSDEVVQALYKTDFFANVHLFNEVNTLVISVVERATIGRISFEGNKKISTKKLHSALKTAGIREGLPFNQFSLKAVKQAIEQQYQSIGQYRGRVTVKTKTLSENRVGIVIQINEGRVARIQSIQIVGNHAYTTRKLLKEFSLTGSSILTWITHNDRYSRAKLDADLAKLTNFYLDHGYLKFRIDDVEIDVHSVTNRVRIIIRVTEGSRYRVSGYSLTGNLLGQRSKVESFFKPLKQGDFFSRSKIVSINKKIQTYFSDQGYAFAQVSIVPSLNETNKTVFLKFVVIPGQLVYIHRIDFSGNTKTASFVLRREMRLMEGSPYSITKINESKRRLANMPYLKDVKVIQTPTVGDPRQVDLHLKVKDVSSAKANFRLGYSNAYGFLYGASIDDYNFMGSGKRVGIGLENSKYTKYYFFKYNNPYFTPDGISQGFTLYSQRTTPGKVSLTTSYTTDVYGGTLDFGVPVSDYSRVNLGLGFDHLKLKSVNAASAVQVRNFVAMNGNTFNTLKAMGSWIYRTYDRAIFPTKGISQTISGEVSIPTGTNSLRYYKAKYALGGYLPISHGFILHGRMVLGYGDGYGKFGTLPFFLNYYAGGIGSVAGYDSNTLGPRDSNNEPIGGNILTTGSISLILPQMFTDYLRVSVFVDAGNVYQSRVNLNRLRYSAGVGFDVVLPIFGQVRVAVAKAIKKRPGDDTQVVDFSFGAGL